MKSHTPSQDRETASRALASRHKAGGSDAEGLSVEGQALQRKRQAMIDASPYMSAQRKRLGSLSRQPAQRASPEEEELLQGKSAAQRMGPEEEELVQGKFAIQRKGPEEEEEMLQGKLAAQRRSPEEEELLQGRFAAQRLVPEEEEEMIQGKFAAQRLAPEEEELMQGKFTTKTKTRPNGTANQPPLQRSISSKENRTGIPDALKVRMENNLGADFSDVTVHADSSKARDVGALAYTQGTDVHFAPGQFKPESDTGRQLLGHELAHVVQQRAGKVSPTTEVAGLPVNDEPGLEKEADEMGKKI